MSKRIVLDNCVMTWALKGSVAESSDENLVKAKRLLEKIEEDKDELVIPSIVLFEFLSIFDPEESE